VKEQPKEDTRPFSGSNTYPFDPSLPFLPIRISPSRYFPSIHSHREQHSLRGTSLYSTHSTRQESHRARYSSTSRHPKRTYLPGNQAGKPSSRQARNLTSSCVKSTERNCCLQTPRRETTSAIAALPPSPIRLSVARCSRAFIPTRPRRSHSLQNNTYCT